MPGHKLAGCDGRITVATKGAYEEREHSREYQYTFHDNGHERMKYALDDWQRLERIERGWICFYGIVAVVELDGAEIGHSSVWGIESDSGDDYFISEARNEICAALAEARQWIGRRKGAA